MYKLHIIITFIVGLFATIAIAATKTEPMVKPPGEIKLTTTLVLEAGAKLMQNFDPLSNYNVYLVAFHPLKDNPDHQMVAYHYCKQVNEEFMQCVLFDSNTKQANMNGLEYIISGRLFNQLPAKEQEYWHPHNYEILSGQLIAPGIPNKIEKLLLKKKMNSYGKTWHVWMTGNFKQKGDDLPLGEAHLAWSFNHDDEIQPDLLKQRDSLLKVDTVEKRNQRKNLMLLAKPQQGEDTL